MEKKNASALKAIFQVLHTNTGRDKTFRLFQYFFNFTAEYLAENNFVENKTHPKYLKCRNIANSFAMARKVIRFSKHFALFERLIHNIK